MEYGDNIVGRHIHAILEQLKNGKTLVRMVLMGKDYEQLTIISDIRKKDKVPFLLIDCPDGFEDLLNDSSNKLHFEYTGANKLPYYFYTDIARVDQKIIWAAFPDLIERRQLRRDFRVDMPSGTRMGFKKYGVKYDKQVINLSLGGSFGALIRSRDMTQSELPISVGDTLTEIELVFQSKHFEQQVNIRKAVVVRFEENPLQRSYCYAIHFLDMDKTEEKALTELIYVIQREYLKKRLIIAD
ncbi:MAG: PilZ domain-containing protein [Deltaproteobacteria bacterium]|nr:PilZ domain-containing protein [Deltaproteobacteria bacterium]